MPLPNTLKNQSRSAMASNSLSKETIIITIDGPAGAGKSTVAKELARRLGFAYLDTGAMYRALTLKALRKKMNLTEEEKLIALMKETFIDIDTNQGSLKVILDGENVTEPIRSIDVTNHTAFIARVPGVREVMVVRQREIASRRSVVVEGRDTGTVVFPNATHKFYLDADFKERARRRITELKQKGQKINDSLISNDLKERDEKDLTRKVGPLKKADDAVFIDSTGLSVEQTAEKILQLINSHG